MGTYLRVELEVEEALGFPPPPDQLRLLLLHSGIGSKRAATGEVSKEKWCGDEWEVVWRRIRDVAIGRGQPSPAEPVHAERTNVLDQASAADNRNVSLFVGGSWART